MKYQLSEMTGKGNAEGNGSMLSNQGHLMYFSP